MRALLMPAALLLAGALAGQNALSPYDLGRVAPGVTAPDFELPDPTGKSFQLSSLRGRNVVLVFYRGYW